MDTQTALDLGREALMVALIVSFPMLCVGMVVGVLISIFQAVTQIQEMTLTFVPKILAMAVACVFFMPWILDKLADFTRTMLGPMPIP